MILDRRKIVVTGGAGFIGSHVVDQLAALGAEVVVIDDLSVGDPENIRAAQSTGRVKLVKADIRELDRLTPVLEHADVVFHLAVQCLRVSLSDPWLVHDVNATGTLRALQAAKSAGVGRFIYVSSSEVYGSAVHQTKPIAESDPLNVTTPYAASKAAGELYTRSFGATYGLRTTILRPFNAYGPRAHSSGPYGEVIPRFIALALKGEPPVIFGDGKQTRDFTYVEDTARGIVACGLSPNTVDEVVNIARGREISIAEVASKVVRLCNHPELKPIFEAPRPADVRRHLATIEKAEELVGFRAQTDFEEGLKKYLLWIKEKGTPLAQGAHQRNW